MFELVIIVLFLAIEFFFYRKQLDFENRLKENEELFLRRIDELEEILYSIDAYVFQDEFEPDSTEEFKQ